MPIWITSHESARKKAPPLDDILEKMNNNELPKLVRFCPINEYTLDYLRTGNFYIPGTSQLNDPLESVIGEFLIPHLSDHDSPNAPHAKKDEHEKIMRNTGVFSCSEFDPSKPYFLQWAHYGDQHHGIALQITPKEDPDFPWVKIDNYSGSPPKFKPTDSDPIPDTSYIVERLSWKFEDWTYEKEYRLIFPHLSGVKKSEERFFKLDAVYFGLRVSKEKINEVILAMKPRLLDEEGKLKAKDRRPEIVRPFSATLTKEYRPFNRMRLYKDDELKQILDVNYIPKLTSSEEPVEQDT